MASWDDAEAVVHEADESFAVPTSLHEGRYRLGERLGAGGMATVHRCTDVELDIERAVKVRRRMGGKSEATALRRLSDEARIMAKLDHPRVLPVYDIGHEGPWHYVVMELATGGTLSDVLEREGPLGPRRAVDLILDVLEAVEVAHAHDIIHRDIKPQNILVGDEGRPWLADWGIARLSDREQTLTRTHVGMGSMAYMAPEQRQDAHGVGPTADLYATGATLYHLITAETSVDLFHAKPSSPRWDAVPVALRPILGRVCALRPDDRYPDVASFAEALRAVRDQLPVAAVVLDSPPILDGGTLTSMPEATAEPLQAPIDEARPAGTPWTVMVAIGAVGVAIVAVLAALAFPFAVSSPTPASIASSGDPSAAQSEDPPQVVDGERAELPAVVELTDPPAAVDVETGPPEGGVAPVQEATGGRADPPDEREDVAATPDEPGNEGTPDPPAEASGAGSTTVAHLPIHGPWRGSLNGSVARLSLDGPTSGLSGWLTLGGERGRVTGSYVAGSRNLLLEVSGPGDAAGTWTLTFEDDRLDGRVARRGSADVFAVHLARSPGR